MENRMNAFVQGEFDKTLANFQAMAADAGLRAQIAQAVGLCVDALRAGNKILFAGNGGSAADAQHWAGELVSRFYYDRPGLPAIALTTDSSILTAIGVARRPDLGWLSWLEDLTHHHWSWIGTVLLGLGMMTWIGLQLVWIELSFLHVIYGIVGLLLVGVAAVPSYRLYLAGPATREDQIS